ncbi:hypothetical protein BRADI_4g31092v3 [Brachypodium distachyon]|uniref:Uncharacterized protein n=1 Tax=Brachypodium distachyon TaxID=15368 RepID=A0A2K2CRK0_BRADI|nr:hypothetical protein BRADI_4g31092v3 [Brachypodium distachyon]
MELNFCKMQKISDCNVINRMSKYLDCIPVAVMPKWLVCSNFFHSL